MRLRCPCTNAKCRISGALPRSKRLLSACVVVPRLTTPPPPPFPSSPPALGAAYGTAKSGTGIAAMSVMRPELIMKSIIPVVMAGIIAIYGLVVAVLIANGMSDPSAYSLYT